MTAATDTGKTTIIVNGKLEGAKFAYELAANAASLTAVTYGQTWSGGTDMVDSSSNPVNALEVTASTNTVVRVVELDASSHAIAYADAIINKG